MKIICVENCNKLYNKDKIAEEDREQATESSCFPSICFKPDSSLLCNGRPFYIPDFSSNICYKAKLVVKINRLGKNIAERFAHRYYEELTIGLDLVAKDIKETLESDRLPIDLSVAFDNSAVIGDFISKEEIRQYPAGSVSLDINGTIVQRMEAEEMLSGIDYLISFISQYVTLKIGDLILVGDVSAGNDEISINDHIIGTMGDRKLLDFRIL
ncbi:fumarylacetoacetate hydrolase family protein [Dysgonomonas sp. 520]|uniref:fumarylacetoacetate hydrolase family protein n=1 Tax=Dysgonomonas sp. 520 TaxID=2302931 RepID=UPI0013D7682D|nr:fumarylacetoacetate hydrolase family protein [Dysgonomonas sp. 520]NDW09888.1 2-hydroxyhepta-2,4-diene-1,7-dioate isomerase [Dysgonomonas sp. 520]